MSSYPSAKDSLDSQRDPHHTHAPDSPNGLSQQMALTTLDGQPEEEWNELLNEPWQTTYEVFNTSLGNVNAPTQQAPYPMSTADFGHHPTSASSGTSSISFRSNNSQENVSTLFNNDNNNAYPPSFFSTQEINYGDPFDFLNRTYHKEDEPVNFNFDQPPLGNMFDYRPAATHLPPTNTAFHHPTILDAGAMSTFENVPARASEEVDASPELDQDQSDINEPCYAQLLYKCLSDAPQHTLSLKELYQWVVLHSQKGKDPEIKGWMNSVRHNLSMNAAFERVPPGPGSKKGSLWRLTAAAIGAGVLATTRYRKDPKKKSERRGLPAPKRQISGAKGGQATRRAATRRQAQSMASYPLPAGRASARQRQRNRRDATGLSPFPQASARSSPTPSTAYSRAPTPYIYEQSEDLFNPNEPVGMPPLNQHSHFGIKSEQQRPVYLLPINYPRQPLFSGHEESLPNTPALTDAGTPDSMFIDQASGEPTFF